jgi:hypothetical protein
VIYLVYKDRSRFVAFPALLALAVSVALVLFSIVTLGLGVLLAVPLAIALAIAVLVYTIIAAIQAITASGTNCRLSTLGAHTLQL